MTIVKVKITSVCPVCHRWKEVDIGDDPLIAGRLTEILKPHRFHLRRCAGSGQDANPIST